RRQCSSDCAALPYRSAAARPRSRVGTVPVRGHGRWAGTAGVAVAARALGRVPEKGPAPRPSRPVAGRELRHRPPRCLLLHLRQFSFSLVLTLYMQLGLGFSPLQSGTTVMPLAIAFAIMSRIAGPRAQQRGTIALVQGCGVQLIGLAILG